MKRLPQGKKYLGTSLGSAIFLKIAQQVLLKELGQLIATSALINIAPPMARLTVKPTRAIKQKEDRLLKTGTNKKAKITRSSAFLFQFSIWW